MAASEARLVAMIRLWEERGFRVKFMSQGGRHGCEVETLAGDIAGWAWVPKKAGGSLRPIADVQVEALRRATYSLARERKWPKIIRER